MKFLMFTVELYAAHTSPVSFQHLGKESLCALISLPLLCLVHFILETLSQMSDWVGSNKDKFSYNLKFQVWIAPYEWQVFNDF